MASSPAPPANNSNNNESYSSTSPPLPVDSGGPGSRSYTPALLDMFNKSSSSSSSSKNNNKNTTSSTNNSNDDDGTSHHAMMNNNPTQTGGLRAEEAHQIRIRNHRDTRVSTFKSKVNKTTTTIKSEILPRVALYSRCR